MTTELRFVHAGMGNFVCANRIVAMINPGTACGKRFLKEAKKTGGYIDACLTRPMKTLILLDDGGIMGSAITAKTLARRINKEETGNATEEEEEDNSIEDHRPVGEDPETDDA